MSNADQIADKLFEGLKALIDKRMAKLAPLMERTAQHLDKAEASDTELRGRVTRLSEHCARLETRLAALERKR